MALLCSRMLSRNLIRKNISVVSKMNMASRMPTPEELVTGKEKFEMDQRKAGNEDPFRMKAMKRQPSTKNNPNLIPSYYDCRIVGCVCEEDSAVITWMWLFKGAPKRCHCGHWFKLVEYKPI